MKKRIRNSTKIIENDLKSVNNRKNMKFKRKEIRKIELKKKQLNNYSILKTPDP